MPTYAFVDAPTASPTVLFDLNGKAPFGVAEGTKTSPPSRRVSSFGSSAQNGDVIAQEAYNDRVLSIRLRFEPGKTPEQHADGIQKLARLLDGPQWLKWQSDGKVEPVFYRTKYGEIDIDDDMLTTTKVRRDLSVNITAEPFGYGLPVTGTATIANDPTTGTNKMSYVMPTVQGDVAAPLWFEWKATTGTSNHHTRAVIAASAGDITPSTLTYLIFNTTSGAAASGWSHADAADATMLNGTRRRLTKSSGTALTTVASAATVSFVPGDYRVLVRCLAPAGATLQLGNSGGTAILSYTVPATSPGELAWYDMGVARMPIGQPLTDSSLGLVPTLASQFSFQAGLSTGTGVIDADAVLFIPAGLDKGVAASLVKAAPPYALSGVDYYCTLDSINGLAYSRADFGTGYQNTGAISLAGGFPTVTPGVKNVIHLVPYLFGGALDAEPDSKSKTAAISWKYYPQYLYDRPAAS